MKLRTWHIEGAVVAGSLMGALLVFGKAGDWREWVAALGVQLGFHHASVADRLREAEEMRRKKREPAMRIGEMCAGLDGRCGLAHGHDGDCCSANTGSCRVDGARECECIRSARMEVNRVECVSWLQRYWVLKEVAWVAYFLSTGAVSALVGCAVFVAHPFWRRWYRAKWPR